MANQYYQEPPRYDKRVEDPITQEIRRLWKEAEIPSQFIIAKEINSNK